MNHDERERQLYEHFRAEAERLNLKVFGTHTNKEPDPLTYEGLKESIEVLKREMGLSRFNNFQTKKKVKYEPLFGMDKILEELRPSLLDTTTV